MQRLGDEEERLVVAQVAEAVLEGGVDVAARIRGDQLNEVLGVTKYVKSAWYVVTADGVEKL